jgi:hypothetical protein
MVEPSRRTSFRLLRDRSRVIELPVRRGLREDETRWIHTGVEDQVNIFQIGLAFGKVTAGHSDATKAHDAVLIAKSGGLDIAKRDRRWQMTRPHVPSSPSVEAAHTKPPPPKPRGGLAALAGKKSEQPR